MSRVRFSLFVVLALGAIVGARLMADRDVGRVRLVTPVVGPTADVSLLPSPTPSSSGSPSVSPSPSPTDKDHYVSEDGVWELFYPKDWFGPDEPHVVGDFANYRNSPKEVGLPIKVDLNSYSTEPKPTDAEPPPKNLDELLASMCKDYGGSVQVFECKKVVINGRTWAWALLYSEEDEPAMGLDMRTIVGSREYTAWGYVFATKGQGPGIAQIREVFESVVLNV